MSYTFSRQYFLTSLPKLYWIWTFWFWRILSSSAVVVFLDCKTVMGWGSCYLRYLDREWVREFLCVFPACMWREGCIPFCYIMMRYWVYDLVTFLSCPAQIAFHNLMRQIFFNGNPGQGLDCYDKLRLQLFKAGIHTLFNALCNMIGFKSTL